MQVLNSYVLCFGFSMKTMAQGGVLRKNEQKTWSMKRKQ